MSKGLTVKGIAKLEAKLRKGTNLSDVKNVVKLNGSELQASAMRFAPVDTGYLKRNIHLSIENSGMTARISSDASYAPCYDRAKYMVTCILGLTKIGENL